MMIAGIIFATMILHWLVASASGNVKPTATFDGKHLISSTGGRNVLLTEPSCRVIEVPVA